MNKPSEITAEELDEIVESIRNAINKRSKNN